MDSLLDSAILAGDLEAIRVKRAVHNWTLPHDEVWRICQSWHKRQRHRG